MIKNYYEILNIGIDASNEEITSAYRKLLHYWHPDKNKNINANNKTREIIEAYKILSDPNKRAVYNSVFNEIYSFKDNSEPIEEIYNDTKEGVKKKAGALRNDIYTLNNWIKNIRNNIDDELYRIGKSASKHTESFFFYVPIIIVILFIMLIFFLNIH